MTSLKTKATIEILDRASGTVKKINKSISGLGKTFKSLGRDGKAASKASDGLKKLDRNSSRAARGMRRAALAAGAFGRKLKGVTRAARAKIGNMWRGFSARARRAGQAIRHAIGGALRYVRNKIAAVGRGLAGLGRRAMSGVKTASLAIVAGVAAAMYGVKKALDSSTERWNAIAKLSKRIGFSQKGTALFKFQAAMQTDAPARMVSQALAAFNRRLGDFQNNPKSQFFKFFDPATKKLIRNARNAEEALAIVYNAVHKIAKTDPARASNMLDNVMSEAGRKLVALFASTPKELANLRKRWELVMFTPSKAQVASLERWSDLNDQMKMVRQSITDSFSVKLAPVVNEALDKFIKTIGPYKERIGVALASIVEPIVKSLSSVSGQDLMRYAEELSSTIKMVVTGIASSIKNVNLADVRAGIEGIGAVMREIVRFMADLGRAANELKRLFSGKFDFKKEFNLRAPDWWANRPWWLGGGKKQQPPVTWQKGANDNTAPAALKDAFGSGSEKLAAAARDGAAALATKSTEAGNALRGSLDEGAQGVKAAIDTSMAAGAAAINNSGQGVGERISAAMMGQANAIGAQIGKAAANQISRAAANVRINGAPAGPSRGRAVHAAPHPAPRGVDRPAAAKSAIADGA